MAEKKIEKLYYSISEVSEITQLKQYVLRYWETEFPMLHPKKNRAGNRSYRQSDIDTILKIKDLLYNQKYTIEGARERLKAGNVDVSTSDADTLKYRKLVKSIKKELQLLLKRLDS